MTEKRENLIVRFEVPRGREEPLYSLIEAFVDDLNNRAAKEVTDAPAPRVEVQRLKPRDFVIFDPRPNVGYR